MTDNRLDILAKYLEQELKKELYAQGHIATAKLYESIKVEVSRGVNNMAISGTFIHYGSHVNRGRRAGLRGVPIDALIEWIRIKKMDLRGKSEKSVAFAIQKSIKKKGIPTNGSDRKKRFMSRVLEDEAPRIRRDILLACGDYMQATIVDMVEKTKQKLK